MLRSTLAAIARQEDLNFLLTNRIPRRLATRFIGWFSRIENPLIREASLATWRLFSDLDLSEAKSARFRSLHDCFIRELKDGARPVDPDPAVLASPCDAIVGACGRVDDGRVLQVKGFPYTLDDLLGAGERSRRFRDGTYVTLRLTAAMYHRFHAPHDGRIETVTYKSGDTWNVNPIALKRIEKLFCKNERALIDMTLKRGGHPLLLVPVAAILVASIRLHALGTGFDLRRSAGRSIPCGQDVRKGQELGWFEHGSTIILFAPGGLRLCDAVREGARIRMGEPLLHLPPAA
ncbi:archaetidylserine decarboxylase [Roseomonas sp. OT10]|uniref:archaetidylserine decarboxylase n=1 Tax=Roseomonas cutis TaxID=2897332 RepID=UPI001E532E79|nr:archaetidylserine decarboxylase [Roseomonas sp. OT10]UFN47138.1 archaetidylserine decarboxylase [Roseomonas sp. OT10]